MTNPHASFGKIVQRDVGDVLSLLDKMTMAVSLEVRLNIDANLDF